uniref:Protein TsetseEP domain-containing protein n=1 Tax=Anopheles farauti TaxID=69004 RepID=A0A182QPA3_9DIPT
MKAAKVKNLLSKMKFVLVLLLASVAWAARPDSVAVVNKLYEVHPLYRQIQDYVINTITDARLSSSSKIYDFHKEVILVKSTFLGTSIKQEEEVLAQVNGQPASVDQQCLAFVRSSIDVNMNLAGVSYSSCITEAGDTLVEKVKSFYDQLDVNEAAYVGVGLFEEFRGENVFYDPRTIVAKLENRVMRLNDYPTHIGSELLDAINGFSNWLDTIRMSYVSCMTMGEQLLKSALQLAQLQLEMVCGGQIVVVPDAPTPPLPPQAEIVPDSIEEFPEGVPDGHRDVTTAPGQNQLTTDDASYGDDRSGPSNPQKRGGTYRLRTLNRALANNSFPYRPTVNPLLYREAELRNDFSGNSIPQNGVWEDVEVPLPGMPYPVELFDAAIEPGPLERFGQQQQQQQQQRTYDVLQSLLNRQPSSYGPLYVGRSTVPGGYPMRPMHGGGGAYGTERKKRTVAGKSHPHLMR